MLGKIGRRANRAPTNVIAAYIGSRLSFHQRLALEKWNRVVKHARSDRKLLGGIVLDFTKQKDQLSAAMGSDRLYVELQRVVLDATASLVESGSLKLVAVDVGAE